MKIGIRMKDKAMAEKLSAIAPGQTFGKLSVKEVNHPSTICVCVCGNVTRPRAIDLIKGNTKQCRSCARTRHGLCDHELYHTWSGMISRCTSATNPAWKDYGGRGIKVHESWTGKVGFERFLKDVGDRPSKLHSLNRINNDGNYEPGNVEWATKIRQARNMRSNRQITAFGKTMLLIEWAEEYNIHQSTIHNRIIAGWIPEDAVSLQTLSQKEYVKILLSRIRLLEAENKALRNKDD